MDRCDRGKTGEDEPRPYGLLHFSSAAHHGDEAATEAKQLDHYDGLAGFLSCEKGKCDQCQ
jgi:hypothetical protein